MLVANGPSLNQMDLRFLKNETTIGLNKIYLGIKKFRFYPRYYVAINRKVIEQSISEINNLNCVKFLDIWAKESGLFQETALTKFIKPIYNLSFSTNLTLGYQEGYTVTHAALQIAYHLGFKKVILIGLDHRYSFEGQPNESRIHQGPDQNHFCENYFGHGTAWDNPDLKNSEVFYRAARQAYEDDGRRIIDATLDGACPVFEKSNYREIFKR